MSFFNFSPISDIELINEEQAQSNLSTKSEEMSTFGSLVNNLFTGPLFIADERELGLCQTTRENRLAKTHFFQDEEKAFPLTCRSLGKIEKENEEMKSADFLKKIDDINLIYEQKIKVLEARFCRSGDNTGF